MEVYHAQKAYYAAHERWAPSLDALGLDPDRLAAGDARITGFEAEGDGFVVTATLTPPDGPPRTLRTDHESRIWEE